MTFLEVDFASGGLTIAVHFILEMMSYNMIGSSKQDSIIRKLRMIDIFCASSHPNSEEILLNPGIFQLKSKYRILDGVK